jgi:arabinose-5-phosphate isomerase
MTNPANTGHLSIARDVLNTEAQAITRTAQRLGDAFTASVEAILACRGRVILMGLGKSGLIARKIAATLASTGTPAFFVHAAEAAHGDLGMITNKDVVIALSNSGETGEVLAILPAMRRKGAKLIALTGNLQSSLARDADIVLDGSIEKEACPMNLAPTASTTVALVLGDALAVAALEARGFSKEDFALSHPGGSLGRRLLTHVHDVMRSGDEVPRVGPDQSVSEAVLEITRKRLGMTTVVDSEGRLLGIFTDGDLRRMIESGSDWRTLKVAQVMTRAPKTIASHRLAAEAVHIMESTHINQLAVVDADQLVVGALNMHDLFAAKVV